MPNEREPASVPAVTLAGLSSGYGKKTVISGLSMSFYAGEISAVIGANGCGKTTLMKSICGLLPYSGSCASADGTEIKSLSPHKKTDLIGYLSSHPIIPGSLSVTELVESGLEGGRIALRRDGRSREIIKAVLDELGIGELADRTVSTLSGGQRQLALIARTLVKERPILALDEPDSALDFARRKRLFECLRKRAAKAKACVIISSHDVNSMLAGADRLLLMSEGTRIAYIRVKDTPPEALLKALRAGYGNVRLDYIGGYPVMTENREST